MQWQYIYLHRALCVLIHARTHRHTHTFRLRETIIVCNTLSDTLPTSVFDGRRTEIKGTFNSHIEL